jgi:hypothetical protein
MLPTNPNGENPLWPFSIIITELSMLVHGRMGLVALHYRVETTTTTLDGKTFTANKVQRHGCYQPTPMGNTPYGHSVVITAILTWVHGRMGLVALHDRVETTTTTSDGKTFTANKVQRHGCYQPTLMCILTEILTWVHGRVEKKMNLWQDNKLQNPEKAKWMVTPVIWCCLTTYPL